MATSLNSFLQGLEAQLAEGLITGTLTNSISTGLAAFLQGTPAASLSDAQTYVNGQLSVLFADAVAKLPGWEQPIANILLSTQTPKIQTWVDGIVSQVYTKLVSQIAGTVPGKQIISGS